MLAITPELNPIRIDRRQLSSTRRPQSNRIATAKSVSLQQRRRRRRTPPSIDSYALLRLLKTHSNAQIHALTIRLGFGSVNHLQTATVTIYSNEGNLRDARQLFDEISQRTVVVWTAMMSGYINNKRPNKALDLFREMQLASVEPDPAAVTTALSACADLGALDIGEWIHTYIRRQGFEEDLILTNALINMYAKCGNVIAARHLFESSRRRDVTTWSSMIVGHAVHGQAKEALSLFDKMRSDSRRIAPNGITFVGVLTACSHAGLVEEALRHWESMESDYGLRPRMPHYGCMVDLLCRAGLLAEAYRVIEGMTVRPNAVVWRTLLSACSLHGEVVIGERARRRLLELEPEYAGDDVAMSNAYAAAGLWDEKQVVRRRMKLRRTPGCSLI